MKRILMAIFISFLFWGNAQADMSGWLKASDVRTYNTAGNNGLIIRVAGYTVDSNCGYPDHLQIFSDSPAYDTAVKLFLSQWTKNPDVHFCIYYTPGECSQGINQGNVKIQGFYFQ